MTIEEIKDNYANEQGRDTWDEFFSWNEVCHTGIDKMQYHHDQIAQRYAQSQTQALKEQNAELVELVERCKDVICAYNNWSPTPTGKEIIEAVNERITKYNHLKSSTNG